MNFHNNNKMKKFIAKKKNFKNKISCIFSQNLCKSNSESGYKQCVKLISYRGVRNYQLLEVTSGNTRIIYSL